MFALLDSIGAARRPGSVLLMLVMLLTCWPSAQAALEDVLARPSMTSAKAVQAAMLSVGRAGSRLVAVGERGIVLVSDSNGQQWKQVATPVSVTLTAVNFPDARHGYAVGHGGVVLASADGGLSWRRILDGRQAAGLMLVDAESRTDLDDPERLALVGEAKRLVEDGPDKPFLDVRFSDQKNGLIVGAFGMALTTEDGGVHWKPIGHRIPNPKRKHLYRIVVHKDLLWLAGEQGALFFSRDGGRSFEEMALPYAGTLFGLVAASESEWLVYGLRGNVFRTSDAGSTWTKLANAEATSVTHGQLLSDGRVVLIDQAGRVLVESVSGSGLTALGKDDLPSLNAVVQAPDGSLVMATLRGMVRRSTASSGKP
ncbi:WD40/YVTN/BNR-like repeat-containing protein [Xenophilus azovorans]|uniref:WD40/YVTN/BNR-like repeat-containing protein n=1 Tax=Xenophilus azovorans TaxID=151755 RepID=UPI00068A7E43|nr:YCF48-related protein [Xenophilus azovorans]